MSPLLGRLRGNTPGYVAFVSYPATRDAIFLAASTCASAGRLTVMSSRLMTNDDAEQAFAQWQADGHAGVAMRVTTTADGAVAAEFTPVP